MEAQQRIRVCVRLRPLQTSGLDARGETSAWTLGADYVGGAQFIRGLEDKKGFDTSTAQLLTLPLTNLEKTQWQKALWFLVATLLMLLNLLLRRNVSYSYQLNNAIEQSILATKYGRNYEDSFDSITNWDDFYEWFRNPFSSTMLDCSDPFNAARGSHCPYVLHRNKLVGPVRLRQLRIKPNLECAPKSIFYTTKLVTIGEIKDARRDTDGHPVEVEPVACFAAYSPSIRSETIDDFESEANGLIQPNVRSAFQFDDGTSNGLGSQLEG